MKKLPALVAAVALAGLALVGTAPAAQAGEEKIELCHFTGSEKNPFVPISVSYNAFTQAGHADHDLDIYDAFSFKNKKGETVNVPASFAWSSSITPNETGKDIWLNGCQVTPEEEPEEPGAVLLDPIAPIFHPATCEDEDWRGTVEIPDQETDLIIVDSTMPKWNEVQGFWHVTYLAGEGGLFEGEKKDISWQFTPEKLAAEDCELPATGISDTAALAIGGGLLLAGGALVGGNTIYRRRNG